MEMTDSSRRGFLKTALAGGALIATANLPCRGEDDPCVFPKRGKFERLALAYHRVEAGATRPFSILHISDTHLTAADVSEDVKKQRLRRLRTQTFGGRQEEALVDSLDWAKANVDYVLHTGDLIDWQSEANFALVKKHFGGAMFGSLGNHEYSPDMWLSEPKEVPTEAFKDLTRASLAKVYPFDLALQSTVVNGVNFVTMDDVYGTFTAAQVERFAAEAKKGLPIALCLHVPLFTPFIWQANMRFWTGNGKKFTSAAIPDFRGDALRQQEDPVTRDFIAYLKAEPLLKAILAGHLHINVQDAFSPTAREFVVGGNFLFQGEEILFV